MNRHAQWVALQTIVGKEIRRFTRIWVQTLIPPAITIGLYFVIFGEMIGRRVGTMSGVNYMEYIVPGLIMMSVITNAYSNVVSSFFSTKFQRSVEELLVSPMPNHIILWGFVLGGVARGLCVAALVTVLAMLFADLTLHSVWVTLAVIFLTAVMFALAGFINAVYARSFDDVSIVPTFVLTPLTYLGGVFYSVSLLPGIWQSISMLNPIVYMVNGFRYGMIGITDVSLWLTFTILTVAILTLHWWALRLLSSGTGLRQ